MFLKSPLRTNIIIALGAFAMLAPAAVAMPTDGPVGGPQLAPFSGPAGNVNAPGATAADSASQFTEYSPTISSDAAQTTPRSPVVLASTDRTDAAQAKAGAHVVLVHSPDRSDAAQRSPGEIRFTHPVPAPGNVTVSNPGTDWDPVAIGTGGGIVLLLMAGGALALRPRRSATA
jgi:hypothetical protein